MADALSRYFNKIGGGMSEVLPGLYIGCLRDANDEKQLATNKISHVLAIHDRSDSFEAGQLCQRLGLVRLSVSMPDSVSADILSKVDLTNDFIENARRNAGNVLVHCFLGSSRSTSIVIAYLMTKTRRDFFTCIELVTAMRPTANPNFGFRMQLKKFENSPEGDTERMRFHDKFTNADQPTAERDAAMLSERLSRAVHYSLKQPHSATSTRGGDSG